MVQRRPLLRLQLRLLRSQALPLTLLHLRLQAVDPRFKKLYQTRLKGLENPEKSSHHRRR